jgi:hypothetical protein
MNKTFEELVADQFLYGGKKYANTTEKEVTDQLTEDYGFKGLLWCVNKYVYRYKNLSREKDLLKVACYMFIIWLKFGYHLPGPASRINCLLGRWVNTTVDVKEKFFQVFMERLNKKQAFYRVQYLDQFMLLDSITQCLKVLKEPLRRDEWRLFLIYRMVEQVWYMGGHDIAVTHDTDTGTSKEDK